LADALAGFLAEESPELGYSAGEFLISGVRLMERDGSYLTVVDPDRLAEKIVVAFQNRKMQEGVRTRLAQFTSTCSRDAFLGKLSEVVTSAPERDSIRLETV
jgi:hypothetical protein